MSSDLFNIIATRKSTRKFSPRPLETDKLLQVIQAGALAPSSGNIQNWSFIVVTDTDKIRALYAHTLDQEPFLSATAAVIVCGDVEYAHRMYGVRGKRLYTVQNCAACIQNMLLASEALELGSVWIGAFDEDKVSSMFDIPNQRFRPQAIVLFGYPLENVEQAEREIKPLDALVFFNRFGNKVLRPHLIYYDWASEWRNQAQKMKAHLAHAAQKLPKKSEAAAEVKEKLSSSFETAKHRMRSVINNLKEEQKK